MSILSVGLTEGEALRDTALAILRARRADLIRSCTIAALRIALERGEVSADDVRAVVEIPDGMNPKCIGAVFLDLACDAIIRRVGFRKSARRVAHARQLSIWRIADRDAATARLAALSAPNATT